MRLPFSTSWASEAGEPQRQNCNPVAAQSQAVLLWRQGNHGDERNPLPADLLGALQHLGGQVSRWLRRETGVNARTMFLIARALGFDLRLAWTPLVDELPQHAGIVAATKALP